MVQANSGCDLRLFASVAITAKTASVEGCDSLIQFLWCFGLLLPDTMTHLGVVPAD